MMDCRVKRKKQGLPVDLTKSGEVPEQEQLDSISFARTPKPQLSERAQQCILRLWRESKTPRKTLIENTMNAWRRYQVGLLNEDLEQTYLQMESYATAWERTGDEEWLESLIEITNTELGQIVLNEISNTKLGQYILHAISQKNYAKRQLANPHMNSPQKSQLKNFVRHRENWITHAYAKIKTGVDRE
jgi:hypothetical protein